MVILQVCRFVINDYIPCHVFHNFKTLSLTNNSQDITTDAVFDESDRIMEKYNWLQFTIGCSIFELHVTNTYSHIKKELDSVSSIDEFKLSIRATVI